MEKDLSKEEQVQWLCGAAAGQLSCLVLQSFWAGLPEHQGASGFWTLRTGHSLLPTSRCLPRLRTRPAECNSHQGGNYWVNELRGDYETIFLCHRSQQEGANATEYERLASIATSGLAGLFSPNRIHDAVLTELRHLFYVLLYITKQALGERKWIKWGWHSEYMYSYRAHMYKHRKVNEHQSKFILETSEMAYSGKCHPLQHILLSCCPLMRILSFNWVNFPSCLMTLERYLNYSFHNLFSGK